MEKFYTETPIDPNVINGIPMSHIDKETGHRMCKWEDVLPKLVEEVQARIEFANPSLRALREGTLSIKKATDDLTDATLKVEALASQYLVAIRQTRTATVGEINQMLSALRDLRTFFLGADHAAEIQRLREFVDVCKVLVELKRGGALDAILESITRMGVADLEGDNRGAHLSGTAGEVLDSGAS